MKVIEYSDDIEIIASGSFILKDKDASVRLHIDMKPEYSFKFDIVWKFLNNDSLDDAKVERGVQKNDYIELIVYNAKNPFGTGTTTPSPVAQFKDGMVLYCNYLVNRPSDDNPRVFTYSFYLGR